MALRFKLGWLPDVPDTRDIPFAAVFRVPRKLPARTALHSTMISGDPPSIVCHLAPVVR